MIPFDRTLFLKDRHTLVSIGDELSGGAVAWRRSLNCLRLIARNFSVDSIYSVNKLENLSELERDSRQESFGFVPVVDGDESISICISAEVILDEDDDQFFFTKEVDRDKDQYSISKKDKIVSVRLSVFGSLPVAEPEGVNKPGSYFGAAGCWEKSGCLNIKLFASNSVVLELVKTINSNCVEKISFNILISSFSYGFEDLFGSMNHGKVFLVHGISSPAVLESIEVKVVSGSDGESKNPDSFVSRKVESEFEVKGSRESLDGVILEDRRSYIRYVRLILVCLIALDFVGFFMLIK